MLTLEEKVGQLLMVGFYGLEPPDYILDWLDAGRIGGVILFTRNIASPAQLAKLTAACHAAARGPILISIDQEGGSVSRLRDQFTESPGAMALGAAGSETLAEKMSAVLGDELRALGINWNYAPVLDITHDINNPSIGTRSISDDKQLVSRIGAAQVRGFQKAIAATVKHFPGSGNTPTDTHLATAHVTVPFEELWENNLVPFRAAIEADAASIMISHITYDALDSEHPGTLSPAVAGGLLRRRMGYHGVIVTDCLEMKAVSDHYSPGESAVMAILAGNDIALMSHTRVWQEAAYEGLLEAARTGRLPLEHIDASVERIQAMKARYAIPAPADLRSIMQPDHLKIAEAAARAGTVLVTDEGILPLPSYDGQRIVAIEFASFAESIAVEKDGSAGFTGLVRECIPGVESHVLRSETLSAETIEHVRNAARQADILVLATRSAHLIPDQRLLAEELLSLAKKSILVCLRNPYDAGVLTGAGTMICTCGDSMPSVQAAVDTLRGAFRPSASLPVRVR